jgi:cytochrome c biogenesis protein CcmG, thiol:disulfide interchange protein DsbE
MHDQLFGETSDRTRRQPSAPPSARRFIAGLGLLLVVGAAVYASTLTVAHAPTAPRAPDAGFYAIGSAVDGVGIGQSAPDFVRANDEEPLLLGLDRNPIRLDDFAGKPLWIVFWTTWCTPCQQEASDIRASYHAHHRDGLTVLAIDVQEPAAAVREYALGHDLDYAIGLDPTGAVKALYGTWGLPAHFFLDGNGVIRDRYFGQLTGELMEQHVRAIIGS